MRIIHENFFSYLYLIVWIHMDAHEYYFSIKIWIFYVLFDQLVFVSSFLLVPAQFWFVGLTSSEFLKYAICCYIFCVVGSAPSLWEVCMPVFPIFALYPIVSGWYGLLSLISSLCIREGVWFCCSGFFVKITNCHYRKDYLQGIFMVQLQVCFYTENYLQGIFTSIPTSKFI